MVKIFPPHFFYTRSNADIHPNFIFFASVPVNMGKACQPMFQKELDFQLLIQPETELEATLLDTPVFREGLNWGKPRFGHPEGKVGLHVREVLDNVEHCAANETARRQLRIVAIAHDTFKFQEFQLGRRVKHHGLLAREFMEKYLSDPVLLDLIELHDEAFYCWRAEQLENQPVAAAQRLDHLLETMGDHLPLYFDFYKCDTQTGDKIQAPLFWFEQVVMSKLK